MTVQLEDFKDTYLEPECMKGKGQCENATRKNIAKQTKRKYNPERGGKEKK